MPFALLAANDNVKSCVKQVSILYTLMGKKNIFGKSV